MYKRDFLILVLAAFSVYFALQNEGPFTFRKAWYYSLVSEGTEHPFAPFSLLPKPVVLDLNGDGSLETAMVTHDHRLVVLRGRGVGRDGDGFAMAQTMADISLRPSELHTPSGQRPVTPSVRPPDIRAFFQIGLAAGYVDPPATDLVHRPRKAVIVVVMENWHVMCLDHNLKKLWTHDLYEEMHSHATIHELAILITHHAVYQADRGLIVIGGSLNLAVQMEEEGIEEDPFQVERDEAAELKKTQQRLGDGEKSENLLEGQIQGADISRHFSYFAFEGGTGRGRWKNSGTEFKKDLDVLKDDLIPQKNYKYTALQSSLHTEWSERGDTELALSHFEKHKYGKGERKKHLASSHKSKSPISACTGVRCEKDAVAKVLGKVSERATQDGRGVATSASEPNAIVAHLKEGMEAVHLYSGRSICKLHLPEGGLHVDLNGDGVMDHIQVVSGEGLQAPVHGHERIHPCYAYGTSGIPPREPLFNGSICGHTWGDAFSQRQGLGDGRSQVGVAPPGFMPIPTPTGEKAYRYGQRGFAIFLNSRGEVTAINSRGILKWRVSTDASWNPVSHPRRTPCPTLKPLALRTHALPTAILAAGSHYAAVLSEHGNLLTAFKLPDIPATELEALDLNGDGLTDILLISNHVVYAYIQVQNLAGKPFGILVLCLIVAMGTIYASQHTGNEPAKKIKRSTDRTD